MERETGIEPATNSLEGCDSTTELLPPSRSLTRLPSSARFLALRAGKPALFLLPLLPTYSSRRGAKRRLPPNKQRHQLSFARRRLSRAGRVQVGGEGRVRTSVARRRQVYSLLRLTALPPPRNTSRAASGHDCFGSQHLYPLRPWAVALQACTCHWSPRVRCIPEGRRNRPWSWRRDSNPRPADYKSAALPA